jgi:hypothetical protein
MNLFLAQARIFVKGKKWKRILLAAGKTAENKSIPPPR